MDFEIFSDTAGAKVSELVDELTDILEDKINDQYKDDDVNIGFVIRCLPKSYNRNSFMRYTKADNELVIDFCVAVEEYEKKYKIEQRFELGNLFLQWLEKGLSNKNFLKNNPNFDTEDFANDIKNLGKENGWFADCIDWSLDLDA